MRVRVDRGLCVGNALCNRKGPGVYELDEDGYNISDGRAVPPGLEDEARLGAAVCPEGAIVVVESGTVDG